MFGGILVRCKIYIKIYRIRMQCFKHIRRERLLIQNSINDVKIRNFHNSKNPCGRLDILRIMLLTLRIISFVGIIFAERFREMSQRHDILEAIACQEIGELQKCAEMPVKNFFGVSQNGTCRHFSRFRFNEDVHRRSSQGH